MMQGTCGRGEELMADRCVCVSVRMFMHVVKVFCLKPQLGLPTAKSNSPAHLKAGGDFRGDQLVRVLSPLMSRRLNLSRHRRESRSRSTGSEDSREAEPSLNSDLEWELPNLRTVGMLVTSQSSQVIPTLCLYRSNVCLAECF